MRNSYKYLKNSAKIKKIVVRAQLNYKFKKHPISWGY